MDISLTLAAFIAGGLTVLAPCIFGALPIVLGRGAEGYQRARRVILGLMGSILVFTVLLKATTALIGVPVSVWQAISGSILAMVGLSLLWPRLYSQLSHWLGLEATAARNQQKAMALDGPVGDYLLGASLGPVFSACSPTYAIIVAIILPNNPLQGFWYLLVFLLGLGALLGLIAWGGNRVAVRFDLGLDPNGWFRRGLGGLLILVGLLIATGLDKQLLSYLVSRGWYDWQVQLENSLR